MKVILECIKNNYDKSNVVEYYLFKGCCDSVKIEWEELFFCLVFK